MDNRWEQLTDEEIYLLKRMAIEAAAIINLGTEYSEEEQKMCEKLTNELIEEDVDRSNTAELKQNIGKYYSVMKEELNKIADLTVFHTRVNNNGMAMMNREDQLMTIEEVINRLPKLVIADDYPNGSKSKSFVYNREVVNTAVKYLKDFKTPEVIHTYWNKYENTITCMHCNKEIEFNDDLYAMDQIKVLKYCPFCGAKMDELED